MVAVVRGGVSYERGTPVLEEPAAQLTNTKPKVGTIFSTCLALRQAQRIEREVGEAEEARAACAQGPQSGDLSGGGTLPATCTWKARAFSFLGNI